MKDMIAIYGNRPSFKIDGGTKLVEILDNVSQNLYRTLSPKQKDLLDRVYVNGLDVIKANSGGHKCITNISGISFLYRDKKSKNDNIPDELTPIAKYEGNNSFLKDIKTKLLKYGNLSPKQIEFANKQIEKELGPIETRTETSKRTFKEVVKDIQQEFVKILKQKVQEEKTEPVMEFRVTKKQILKKL